MANLRNFFITFCVCLVIFSLAAASIVNYFSKEPEALPIGAVTDAQLQNDDIVEFGDGKDVGEDIVGDTFSILVTVVDNKNENIKSVMLIKADKQMKNYWFLSIPMNLVVPVDNVDTKLCEIPAYHDMEYFYGKIYSITGVVTDHRIKITESGISSLVDTLGGISIEVPSDMLEYSDESSTIPTVNLKKGLQKLNGKKVLQFLKYSSYESGVQGQCAAQRSVAKAIFAHISTGDGATYAKKNIGLLLGLFDTDITADFYNGNIGMVDGYASFTKTESQYPGYETKAEDGTSIFTPYVDEATSKFRQFR